MSRPTGWLTVAMVVGLSLLLAWAAIVAWFLVFRSGGAVAIWLAAYAVTIAGGTVIGLLLRGLIRREMRDAGVSRRLDAR